MSHQYKKKHKRRSCDNKIRYSTKNGAYIAMHVMKRKKVILHKMQVYHCCYCNGWHFGRTNEMDLQSFERLERILVADV